MHVPICQAYGLSLSSNRQIPGLSARSKEDCSGEAVDLRISFGRLPDWLDQRLESGQTCCYRSANCDEHGQPCLFIWLTADERFYRFHYAEGIDFILDRDGSRLWIRWLETVSEKDIFSYLLGPVMGFVLRVRGAVCLHASAILIKERAICFVGDAMAGKSTTAMALGRLGYPILTDDILPICEQDGVVFADPGYPRMRLRQRALPMLSALNPDRPPMPSPDGPGRLHFELPANGYRFHSERVPIGAVYLLGDRTHDQRAPYLESPSPVDGIMGIVGNTYITRFLDKTMRAEELRELSRLVNQAPVRRVHAHKDPSRLAALCNLILDDVSDHTSTSAPG